MTFHKGNKYWQLADPETVGRPKKFEKLEDLSAPVIEWLEGISKTKLRVDVVTSKGVFKRKVPQPMTILGLCNHLGIVFDTWKDYKKDAVFSEFITRVEEIIFNQKFTYAAIGEFNSNIIARELGLADKKEVTGLQAPLLENGKELPDDE
jgi:hypothetical protein